MRILCPACSATYDVAETLIGQGRQIRCARCGNDWFALPPKAVPAMSAPPGPVSPVAETLNPASPAPAAIAVPPQGPQATQAPGQPGRRPRAALLLAVAWAASFAVLGAGGYAIWAWREGLVAFWPAAARVYALLAA